MELRAHSSCCRGKLRIPVNYVTPARMLQASQGDTWTVFSRDHFNPKSKKSLLTFLEDQTEREAASTTKTTEYATGHLLEFLQLNSLRLTGSIPSKTTLQTLTENYKSGYFPSLQLACLTATGKPLPSECLQMIFDFVSGEMRRVKMVYKDEVYKSVHHALQPCSVCHKLLAIDVNSDGEIQSSGTSSFYRRMLPTHEHYYLRRVTLLHFSCCEELRRQEFLW